MLANWMKRREVNMHRDDFMFKHFVESSTVSCQLSDMLYRLEISLKNHFQLQGMEVPDTEDPLRWSLTRYLTAAAKKSHKAHIIIIIDGINALKSENSPDGALHWLPTELPSNVRFIVSTVLHGDQDDSDSGSTGSSGPITAAELLNRNRTYRELQRRKCPELRMEPLGGNTRHKVIHEFINKFGSKLKLNEKQHFRIVTARATAQPLFLRMLLYALKLGVDVSEISIDDQLDLYLDKHDTATGLISEILDFSEKYVERARDGTVTPGVLGRVLSAVYVSRNGLSDEEIWGSVELAMGQKLTANHLDSIFRLLQDVTIVVKGLRTFSHEAFRRVVYNKYICTPENHIKQHQLMARYFNRLQPCPRKLGSLAYHLEVSGSWNKLRNALVDVEMFKFWWKPEHKKEFILLWASLTNRQDKNAYAKKLVTGEFDEATMRHTQTPRPYYDVVEEYTRSIEEYKDKYHPKDEQLGDVVLAIADFLLEFAMLGHEETADVPNFIHPMVPNEDFAGLGVPYLVIDEEGNSMICKPILSTRNADDGKPGAFDGPPKANEECSKQVMSTYFYNRWMWIQFPYVALANCGSRFHDGIIVQQKNLQADTGLGGRATTGRGKNGGDGRGKGKGGARAQEDMFADHIRHAKVVERPMPEARISGSLIKMATQPLPHLPIRKPTRIRQPNLPHKQRSEQDEVAGAMDRMAGDLYRDIAQYRYEHDVLVQQKHLYEQKLIELNNEMTDLSRTYAGSVSQEERRAAHGVR
jgi:hypothetical protein